MQDFSGIDTLHIEIRVVHTLVSVWYHQTEITFRKVQSLELLIQIIWGDLIN